MAVDAAPFAERQREAAAVYGGVVGAVAAMPCLGGPVVRNHRAGLRCGKEQEYGGGDVK